MRVTLPSALLATQTAPSPTATPVGPRPTAKVAVGAIDCRSSFASDGCALAVYQSAFRSSALDAGSPYAGDPAEPDPSLIPVVASSLVTPSGSATQTVPSPAASERGFRPSASLRAPPLRGGMRQTAPPTGSIAQTAPAPTASGWR